MRARVVTVIALWASTAFGAVQLFQHGAVAAGAAVGVVAAVLGIQALRGARLQWRRVRSWPSPTEVEIAAGPRRVLLAETGLVGPE